MTEEQNNIPRLTGEEKVNYIMGLNIIRAEIEALKKLVPSGKIDFFNNIIEHHKLKFIEKPIGLEREEAMGRVSDFDKAKIKH